MISCYGARFGNCEAVCLLTARVGHKQMCRNCGESDVKLNDDRTAGRMFAKTLHADYGCI